MTQFQIRTYIYEQGKKKNAIYLRFTGTHGYNAIDCD